MMFAEVVRVQVPSVEAKMQLMMTSFYAMFEDSVPLMFPEKVMVDLVKEKLWLDVVGVVNLWAEMIGVQCYRHAFSSLWRMGLSAVKQNSFLHLKDTVHSTC